MATAVASKGLVTMTEPVRDPLAIERVDAVEFELAADGRVVRVKVGCPRPARRFEALRGRAGAGFSTDEIMALTRGDGDDQ
jgi:bifunctional DNA-binding transcriptional regulator/antitoxin component of YhaV-PrlF toxin-antitoxin module